MKFGTSATLRIGISATLLFSIAYTVHAGSSGAELLYETRGFTAGKDLSRPLGIFFDSATNECYVADTGNHQVIVYKENGMPIFRFYHHVTVDGKRELGEPKSIAVDNAGNIYIPDALVPHLDVLDRNGRRIKSIDPPRDECDGDIRFDNVTLGQNDKVYTTLTCATGRMVAVIGSDFEIERLFHLTNGNEGTSCVTSLATDLDGNIYVTDPCAELMIQIYDQDGRFVSGFGRHDSGFDNFSLPTGIVVMPTGHMWIVDSIRQVVSCFTTDGEFVSYIGGKGDHPGAFNYPTGLSTDGKDRLFVLERAGNRFQCFQIVSDGVNTAGK
jgi:sugar lactone lactonase YvrE